MNDSTVSREAGAIPLWASVGAKFARRMPAGKYRFMNWLCHGRTDKFIGKMPNELGGYRFECDVRDNIAREVFFTGYYEPQESAFVRARLRRGMSFVDAGSNWGYFTLLAAHLVGPEGAVVALEPDPRVFRKLRSNIESNRLDHVKAFEIAAADCEEQLVLAAHNESEQNCGTSRLVSREADARIPFSVQSRRLDSLLDEAGLDAIDLLKIDVEGAEEMVLNGMEPGLTGYRYRCILLELHPLQLAERGRTVRDVLDLLISKGYKGCALDYSPAAFRKACYDHSIPFSNFIRPLEHAERDAWAHTIWLAPDELSIPVVASR